MSNIATDLGRVNRGAVGDQRLYRVNPPMQSRPWNEDEPATRFDYVVVSASDVMFSGPETYIFGANAGGTIIDWTELPGSFRGALDHQQALLGAGYFVEVQS